MVPVYTSGDWHVKPGLEQEFVEVWREVAEWSGSQFDPQGRAMLLHDKEDPGHFVSVGEWPDEQVVEEWRRSSGYKERVNRIMELVEGMRISTLDLVAEAGSKPAGS